LKCVRRIPDYGVSIEQVPNQIVDLRAMVLLGVSRAVPKADAQNSIGLRVGNQHHFVDEAALFFRIGIAFSSLVSASSLDFPDLHVSSC